MKFSICTTWGKQKRLEDIVDMAASLVLDGVEIWDGHIDEFMRRNGCGLRDLKKYLDEKKLACSAIAPYFNLICGESAESSIDCAGKCIEYANGLDCNIIRTFAGNKPSKNVSREEWERCINALQRITGMAEGYKCSFALETHYNQPTDTAESVLYLLWQVNNNHLKVLFDGFNYIVDKQDMMDAYGKLEPYIIHYHLKNYYWESRTCTPLHRGDMDFSGLLQRIKEKGYSGFASFEYFCENPGAIIGDSIQWIKTL